MYNYDNSLPQTDLYSTVCLWSNSRTQTRPYPTIAPHWSSLYPEYLSPSWDEDTQRAVVWTRLQEHRKLATQGIRAQYQALRQEQQTRVESRHGSSSRDTLVALLSPTHIEHRTSCCDITLCLNESGGESTVPATVLLPHAGGRMSNTKFLIPCC